MIAPADDAARTNWIALARAPRIGPVSFFQLLARFGTPGEAIKAMPSIDADREAAARELDATRQFGAEILVAADPDYPLALGELSPPPPVLSVTGQQALFTRPAIALVGVRDASAAGRRLTRDIARGLGESGFVTVSGLARGIDGEAHAASLETGTIAVLAGGVDQIYPPQHRDLYEAIREQGLIVSERRLGHRATAKDFPRRNRIITGLAIGTVVIEAAERSGSLISARMAGEQGREVMAVPGSPLDPRSAGTNRLIRNGALLVRHAGDIAEAVSYQLGPEGVRLQPTLPLEPSETGQPVPEGLAARIFEALSPTPMPIAEIARTSQCTARQCAAILMELEIEGTALTHAGGLASRA
ncbi:DNA-processing protein DprA [Henriciella aquimarina]|uniref:DNA-processing protein DprA n=1 Tax=Henriciella aquimarina TaxID=545261 RepID=UPI000A06F157|nr:DNA-processing protein DprA [Henriciella aquimarina]